MIAVAVALRPADFAGGARSPDGSGWWWPGAPRTYAANPRLRLEAGDYEMVRCWRLYRGGGMGGVGYLPSAVLDEPAVMLDAFDVLSGAEAQLRDKDAWTRGGRDGGGDDA